MEELILFELFLYSDETEHKILDEDFFADRIIMLPRFRPHHLERAVELSVDYCQNKVFKQKLLEKSIECPVLIFRLFKRGVFVFEEIEPFLRDRNSYLFCYYFRQEIIHFESFIRNKRIPNDFEDELLENRYHLDQLIEFGFLSSSIEYCLKYDVIDVFRDMTISNEKYAKWSLFEWSCKPKYLDLLSFSGFFGSIKCFKQLILNEYEISNEVISMVVCSGCFDLFHFCQRNQIYTNESLYIAVEYCQLHLLAFMIENGADINIKNDNSYTLLHYSADFCHLSIIEFLITKGVDIKAKTKNGSTPLHFAALKGNLRVVEYLMNHGADIHAKDEYDYTPLHFSAQYGHFAVVEFFVNNGAEINSQTSNIDE